MYEALLSPYKIGNMELKNRMIVSAAVTRLANEDGTTSEAFIRYHEDKAKGGWAMLCTEDIAILPNCRTYRCLPGMWADYQIESHKQFTDRIHAAGAKMCAQLYHAGYQAKRAINGCAPKAPSAINTAAVSEVPEELTVEEIHDIVKAFGAAAGRAKAAGYDAVEIHGAHGYLLHQFLSGTTNRRTDEYGGSLYNRNRMLLEVIKEVRSVVGADFPILLRLSVVDYTDNGTNVVESTYTARLAEEAGVDCIHASNGTPDSVWRIIPPAAAKRGLFADNAAAIKAAVNIPVIAVGRINDPAIGDSIIKTGKADFVTMFRASLADPELPNKVMNGNTEDINFCIGCLQGCLGANRRDEPFSCLVRPLTGRAHETDLTPVAQPKKIAIIGGGVSGTEAAIFAAMRGHEVTIYEKSDRLGGRWIAAAIPPGKAEYDSFIYWQKRQLDKYGVKVNLNTEVTVDMLKQIAPDEVVLACGAKDFIPPIPGADLPHVVKALDILLGKSGYGDKCVVIGGGLVGAETADYIAAYGKKKVSVVEMMPNIVSDGEPNPTYFILEDFKKFDVDVYTSARVKEITEKTVKFSLNDEDIEIPADTVVMATGIKPDNTFADALKAAGFTVHIIGDALSGKNGLSNIREGFRLGVTI